MPFVLICCSLIHQRYSLNPYINNISHFKRDNINAIVTKTHERSNMSLSVRIMVWKPQMLIIRATMEEHIHTEFSPQTPAPKLVKSNKTRCCSQRHKSHIHGSHLHHRCLRFFSRVTKFSAGAQTCVTDYVHLLPSSGFQPSALL